MTRILKLHCWLVLVWCWTAVYGLPESLMAAEAEVAARGSVKVMFMFKEVGAEGIRVVENVLTQAFLDHGYSVLDHDIVAQALRRDADLLQLYETEAAKRLGSRLGANIVVRWSAQARPTEKTYESLGGKKVTVSQADVSAKAILVSSGKVLVAETEHDSVPFDTTGNKALEKAAKKLAGKLPAGIDQFLSRETIDYHLVVLNINHIQSLRLQEALRTQVQGVRRVSEQGFVKNTLELDVSVEKQQDVAFKRHLFAGFAGLGAGSFTIVAREGETIYLQRTGDAGPPVPSKPPPGKPSPPPGDKRATEHPESKPEESLPPGRSLTYKPGYRKSWAVVIGINDYQQWPKLAYAVKDAEAIKQRLQRLGFDEVISLFDGDATQRNILRVLGDELYAKTEDEDRVFIFFAGHGQTQDVRDGKVGYIIPVNGDLKDYYSTAISMRQLQDLSDRLRAKHILYVMDSCFSGLLMRFRGEVAANYYTQTTAPVRQVLTAGSEGEEVVELGGHGLFTKMLLAGLEREGDLNGDGYITVSELYQFITPRVLQESRNAQNPVFGRLGSGRGEFVFTLRQ